MLHKKILSGQALQPQSKRKRMGVALILLFSALLAFTGLLQLRVAHADGPTVTINKNIQYQQIEGFGTYGNKLPDYFGNGESDRWNDDFLNYLVGTLGVTMNREAIPASYEATRGQYDTSVMKTEVDFVNALEAKASTLGQPQVKIILSIWSPPAWMKQNNSTFDNGKGANQLKDDDQTRQDFADFVTHYLNDFKSATGFYPYAVSLQNEPQLSLSYDSCYYFGPQLAHLLAVVGPALQNAGIPTKIFYPEDVSDLGHLSDYLTNAEQDPTAKQYIGAFAVHGYSANGVDPAADDKNFWSSVYNLSAQYNLPNWMTETSGYDTTKWSAAQQLGVDILSALKYGHLSAWVWWTNTDWDNPPEGLLANDGSPTWRSEVSEQFYHYIRPGAVMLDANSNDDSVLSVAFNDSANHTLTSVLINNSSSDKTVSLNFQGSNLPSQYTAYRTSSSEAVVNVGTVTNSVTLPANSVTTLTGTFSGDDGTQAPTIQQQPQSQTVSAGQKTTLTVLTSGTHPLTYQWKRNGVNLDGQIGPQYVFSATNDDNGAQYTVTVTNAYGQVTSQAATITIGSFNGAVASYSSTAVTNNTAPVWSTAASYAITNVSSAVQNGFGGSFQVAWDNNNLYFLVQVNDPNYSKDSDAIEVYLDGNNDKSASYDTTDWQIALGQSDYSMSIYQNGVKINPPAFPSYGQYGGSSGYTQLLSVPWSDLNQTPGTGGLVGVDVALIQGAANGKLFWHATSNDDWHNPSLFGTAELSTGSGGGATPTPSPTATATAVATATATATPSPTPTGTPGSGGALPSPWQSQDIGSVSAAGSASYNSGTYSVNGSGSDIGGSADSFQYTYQSLNGNGTIIARVASMDYPNGYARAGVMIRESLNANATFAFAGMNVCCGGVTEARTSTGGGSSWNPTGSGSVPYWVKLVRSGNTFTSFLSSDGQNWTQVDSQTISMASSVYIGLAVTSYNNGLVEHATFDNVSVTTP